MNMDAKEGRKKQAGNVAMDEAGAFRAVARGGRNALLDVPEELKTPALCMAAVRRDGMALRHVPRERKTPEVCMAAVLQNPMALALVPPSLRSAELCAVAVLRNPSMFRDVPDELRTEEMRLCAGLEGISEPPSQLEAEDAAGGSGKQEAESPHPAPDGAPHEPETDVIPKNLETEASCIKAVATCGRNLFLVPWRLRTAAVCTAAVWNDGAVLGSVPMKARTEALCTVAVWKRGASLAVVPPAARTAMVCTVAVWNDGSALELVPERLKTPELCLDAVRRGGFKAYFRVPEKLRTKALFNEASMSRWERLKGMEQWESSSASAAARRPKTAEDRMKAVRKNGLALRDVPEHFKTEKLCRAAVEADGMALAFVPERRKTAELCAIAVQSCGMALLHIPKRLATLDTCLRALWDGELCKSILRRDPRLTDHVPDHLLGMLEAEAEKMQADAGSGASRRFRPPASAIRKNTEAVPEEDVPLRLVPKDRITRAACLAAVKRDGMELQFVLKALRGAEICLEAVKQNALALQFVPDWISAKAPWLCLEAVLRNPQAADFVPQECSTRVEVAAAGIRTALRVAGEQGGTP